MNNTKANINNRYKILLYNPQDKVNALMSFLLEHGAADEEWRELRTGSGCYLCSSKGRVLSLCNRLPKERKQQKSKGYNYVSINGKNKRVNRLVANLFIDNPCGLPVVHHIDGNKENNDVSNLQWTTYSENTKEYWRNKKAHEEQNNAADGEAEQLKK